MSKNDTIHFHRRAEDEAPSVPAPAGMTEEQLAFFTEQTERATKKGTKEGVRRFRRTAVLGYLTLLVGLVFVWGQYQRDISERRVIATQQRHTLVESGRAVAVNSCNQRYEDRLQIRGVLIASRQFVKDQAKRGVITPERRKTSLDFYDERLRQLKLPDCRKDQKLLTDDPATPIPDIPPFYPGAPYAPQEIG